MPRFIFFKGLYSTLDLYTDEMLRICRERGYDSFVLHTTQGEDASCMHISEEQEKEERKELLRFLKELFRRLFPCLMFSTGYQASARAYLT